MGTAAPDLSDKLLPSYAPSTLASALWNHTPAMWRAMAQREVGKPEVTGAEWEDLFAWLYSLQSSTQPAEVGRGKLALEPPTRIRYDIRNGHRIRQTENVLAQHDRARLSRLDGIPAVRSKAASGVTLLLPEAPAGRLAFAENCRQCHTGPMALENRSSGRTFMDLSASMWNHAPRMAAMSKPGKWRAHETTVA